MMMPAYKPAERACRYRAALARACAGAAVALAAGVLPPALAAAASADEATQGKSDAMKTTLVRLGATRYAIPDGYLDGPLDFRGEEQQVVLLEAWLPDLAQGVPVSQETWQSREFQNSRVAILLRAPAVKDGKVQDVLAINYRLYVGDLGAAGMRPRTHGLEPALDGLRSVTGRDETTEQWKEYPDLFIEGEEDHPTTLMHCGRAGVGGVNFPSCSIDFMAGETYVDVRMNGSYMKDWRRIRDTALRVVEGFRVSAEQQR
jgi:hypothetical protein